MLVQLQGLHTAAHKLVVTSNLFYCHNSLIHLLLLRLLPLQASSFWGAKGEIVLLFNCQ